MAVRPIVIAGEPVLHRPADTVDIAHGISPDIAALITDMFDTLKESHGVGLAAPQIGVGKRLFVIDCPDTDLPFGDEMPAEHIRSRIGQPGWSDDGTRRIACVINPILRTDNAPYGHDTVIREMEGCLSVPGARFAVDRMDWAEVTGIDEHGDPITLSGYGFFAKCLQHEVGHLEGQLYIDIVPPLARRKVQRLLRNRHWTVPGNTWMPGVDPDPFA